MRCAGRSLSACRPVSLLACQIIGLLACQLLCLSASAEEVKTMTILRPGEDEVRKKVACFSVEIAADEHSIERGLSGRDSIPSDRGMLFILGDNGYSFWTKGMRFPIDMVVFDRGGTVISTVPELRPCERCSLIRLPAEAACVLEINAGLSEKLGIRAGDIIDMGEVVPCSRF